MVFQYIANGLVATTPRYLLTAEGLSIATFRLASNDSNGDTSWFTVTSYNNLARNVNEYVTKGDRVIVCGPLKVRDWDNGEMSGTSVEIEASRIGQDLLAEFPVETEQTHRCSCDGCNL